ncbi:MAG: alpha-galactosidase [Lachnospiraceae bacterium]|nr:alpha-galactosidase [Lachnospiraceae bacterium]
MINNFGDLFVLNTENTTYAFKVKDGLFLEHLYYGRRITLRSEEDAISITEKHEFQFGNVIIYNQELNSYNLGDLCLEASFSGKGDYRTPFLDVVYSDGSVTSDFIYDSFEIREGKNPLKTMPSSYGEGVSELDIILKERSHGLKLILTYSVFENPDVITRSSKVINSSEETVLLKGIMSAQLDMPTADYKMTTFNGTWIREMCRYDTPMTSGKHVNSSSTGVSSNDANPFFMISSNSTTEENGNVYAMNLVYSGNHAEIAEVGMMQKLRVSWGINPSGFSWELVPGEEFEAPEAVLSFSDKGYNGVSANMHEFVRENIVRSKWKDKERPILLNSWEAAYFDINERKLLKLAREAKNVGIELFVMDDGWFGERNDDTRSLGDWTVNSKKLPNGIKGLADKINEMGLLFGIWVEPEMVNVNSELFKKHPDWTLEIPDKDHSEGRNQRVLNLGLKEVQDFIIDSMSKVFSAGNIAYVKWDMNRKFSDIFSQLPYEDGKKYVYKEAIAGEVCHRYTLGLYRCMKELTEAFPDILFEGCASGGNRFDLGILSYFPQIWGSDDTDALSRCEIQNGYSYGYPQNTVGSHVSAAPNHQTLRTTSLNTRFCVAAFGSLGYECNLCDMSKNELEEIKEEIILYKKYREVLQGGRFYRGRSFSAEDSHQGSSVLRSQDSNVTEWMIVSSDKKKAVGMILQKNAVPGQEYQYFNVFGLDESLKYHVVGRDMRVSIKAFGDLVNTVSPVHVKNNGIVQSVLDRFIKLDAEKEDFYSWGDTLMNAGVKLLPGYCGTGFNDKTRLFMDYSARMYFFEAE